MEINKIQSMIEQYEKTRTGKLGVYFKDMESGATAGIHQDEIFPSASVFKIFVLAELLRQVDAGKYTLKDRFPLKLEDKSDGSGVLQVLDCGAELTLKDYATLMMILSDNTAADFLFKLAGRDNILENVLKPLGLTKTKCDMTCRELIAVCYDMEPCDEFGKLDQLIDELNPNMRNFAAYTGEMERNDETSPADAAKLLELFYRGEWVSEPMSKQAIDIMLLCQTNGRIPKYLPIGTPIAHKTGTMDRVANDTGIVYTKKGAYILSMFYNGNVASEEEYAENNHNFLSESVLAELSKEIYDIYME